MSAAPSLDDCRVQVERMLMGRRAGWGACVLELDAWIVRRPRGRKALHRATTRADALTWSRDRKLVVEWREHGGHAVVLGPGRARGLLLAAIAERDLDGDGNGNGNGNGYDYGNGYGNGNGDGYGYGKIYIVGVNMRDINKDKARLIRHHMAGVYIGYHQGDGDIPSTLRYWARHCWAWSGRLDTTALAKAGPRPGPGTSLGPWVMIDLPIEGLVASIEATPACMAVVENIDAMPVALEAQR